MMQLLRLAIPLAITGLVQSSLYFFENIFLSRLGESTLAAGALVNWLFAALVVIVFGIFSAVNVLVSHKHGAKDKDGIILVLRDGLMLAFLLTIPATILFWNIPSIFLILGQDAELVTLATSYLHALTWGLLPKFMLIVLFEFLIGLGHARMAMMLAILMTPVYILLSYVLIFGKWGFPMLGIAGAGWGVSLADWAMLFVFSIFLLLNKEYKSYLCSIFTCKKPSYVIELIQLGIPIGAMYSIEVGFFLAATLLMGTISVQSLAANQVVMQYLGPLMGIIFSIAQAVTVRMGHQLGAKQFDDVRSTARSGMLISATFMTLIAVIYWSIPGVLIAVDFDLNNPHYAETIRLAKAYLFIAAFFQLFECVRITLFGALRALKDTYFTLITSIISFWGIALLGGYLLLAYSGLGGSGIWYSMVFGAFFSMVLLYWRLNEKLQRYHHTR